MDLRDYHVLFLILTAVSALIVASPALERLLAFPRTEFFTEFWILGSNHRAEDYPFNIMPNNNYSVFLGIGNCLGHCAYYSVHVKFRNQTQSAPNSYEGTNNGLESLLNLTAFVSDEGVWELPLTFSFDYEHNETSSRVELYSLKLNDVQVDLRASNHTVRWDLEYNGFLGNMFFELWLFSSASKSFTYHNRSLWLWLNMTGPSVVRDYVRLRK